MQELAPYVEAALKGKKCMQSLAEQNISVVQASVQKAVIAAA